MIHPENLKSRVANVLRRKAVEVSRCYKTGYVDADGNATLEGQRMVADLRKFAKMDEHAFLRDLGGRIDPLAIARIEGRREVVRRIINLLELDASVAEHFAEVDNGRE